MPKHQQQEIMPYTPQQLYALVADIERYPEFLPWCVAARILSRTKGEGNAEVLIAQLVISFKAFSERYSSKVTLHPPSGEHQKASIKAELVEGPFSHLSNLWEFSAVDEERTMVSFSIDFGFRSRILETLIGMVFEKALLKMVAAFKTRAEKLYGNPLITKG